MSSQKIDYLNFFKTVGKSKRLLRSGWVREKIKDPESVAEHSFRVGVLSMVLAGKLEYKLNKTKLLQMALVHDLAEVITGDIVAERYSIVDMQKRDEKEQKEKKGIKKIFDKIGQGNEYLEIFNEMVNGSTLEARVFKQIDKLEMAIQALEYEEEQGKNLEEFFADTFLHLKEPLIKEIFKEVLQNRPAKERKTFKYESC